MATEISIHAPLTGCDLNSTKLMFQKERFQSTHPLRDATLVKTSRSFKKKHFNPRTPYGMRRLTKETCLQTTVFQSTHPLRDATESTAKPTAYSVISIHAPLTGCDIMDVIIENENFISIHAPLTGCDSIPNSFNR